MFPVTEKYQSAILLGAISTVITGLVLPMSMASSQGAKTIKIDGSSTVFPITEAAAEQFQKSSGGAVRVSVGVSGTGGGFKKFCRGETDISNASRPILQKEIDACKAKGIKFIELPIAYDALTVVVNPQNNWASSMSTEDLKKAWQASAQGKVTNWNQINSSFPNQPLKLFGPGAASGTFDYFTEAINGKAKSSRGDYTASEDDNVLVNGVSKDKGALGYFGLAYYEANKKRVKSVKVNGVSPSAGTVKNGEYQPLSRPLFIYINASAAAKPEVSEFVNFYLKNGARLSSGVKYVALPGSAYSKVAGHFSKKRTGSVFGGKESIGLKIEDMLAKEAID
jgi:phosphate transport system substrate-binding protein